MASSSEIATPLLESDATKYALLVEDVLWAAGESHEMILMFLYPASVKTLPIEEQMDLWSVKYNLFYWLLVVATVPCVLSGRWVHALVGQGGPLREDELPVEREARVQWVYCTDGPFAIAGLVALVETLVAAGRGELGENSRTFGYALDLFIDFAYVGGNMLFLRAIRDKNQAQIRVAIVANGMFAIALSVLLVLGVVFQEGLNSDWEDSERFTWGLRLATVVFFVLATAIYARLWNVHVDAPMRSPSSFLTPEIAGTAGIVLAALTVWVLLIIAISISSPTVIWNAVSRS